MHAVAEHHAIEAATPKHAVEEDFVSEGGAVAPANDNLGDAMLAADISSKKKKPRRKTTVCARNQVWICHLP